MEEEEQSPAEEAKIIEPSWRRLYKSDQEKFDDIFEFPVGSKLMKINQAYAWGSVDTVGLTVWDASLVLAKYVEFLAEQKVFVLEDKRALELGSGCAVTGIAAAMLGADVIVSDWEIVVPLMRSNAELNSPHCKHPIKAMKLKWGVDETKDLGKFDFVLGADLLYQKQAIWPLLQTIQQTSTRDSIILMSYERHNEVPDTFWKNVAEFFDVVKVPLERHHPVYRHPKIEILQLHHKLAPPQPTAN